MGLHKGVTNNPNGRPVGSKNKATSEMRERIIALIDSNFDKIQNDLDSLESKDRLKLIIDLLAYVIPKPQTSNYDKSEDRIIVVKPKNAS